MAHPNAVAEALLAAAHHIKKDLASANPVRTYADHGMQLADMIVATYEIGDARPNRVLRQHAVKVLKYLDEIVQNCPAEVAGYVVARLGQGVAEIDAAEKERVKDARSQMRLVKG
jgi:hypothetical protein